MSTDIKKNDKRDYVEKVMSMTDARFISEAESFRFEKRRTPVSTWIAAACFMLIFAAAVILLIKPMGERPVEITDPTAAPTAELTIEPTAAPTAELTIEPTVEPTAELTAEPSAAPTAERTEAPIPYNRVEYDTLLAFFELADENGVKNGEKCFKDYDPTKVDFWGGESAQYAGLPCFEWNEEGDLVALRFAGDSEKSIKLVGAFMLDGFESLEKLSSPAFMVNEVHTSAFVFDSVKITNCPKLGGAGTFEAIGDVELNGRLGLSQLVSSSRCRFEGRDALSHPMLAELTAEGSGRVELLSHADEHYYPVYINAIPDDGQRFIGWYDADGILFSTKDRIEISDEAIGGCEGEFIYTARFIPLLTVTREMLAEAGYGYVQDGNGLDSVKIAQFLAYRHASMLTDCPDINPEHCIEAEFVDVYLSDGDIVYDDYQDLIQKCGYSIRVRPSDMNAFISYYSDSEGVEYKDSDGDGWIEIYASYAICSTETDGVWACDYLSHY